MYDVGQEIWSCCWKMLSKNVEKTHCWGESWSSCIDEVFDESGALQDLRGTKSRGLCINAWWDDWNSLTHNHAISSAHAHCVVRRHQYRILHSKQPSGHYSRQNSASPVPRWGWHSRHRQCMACRQLLIKLLCDSQRWPKSHYIRYHLLGPSRTLS